MSDSNALVLDTFGAVRQQAQQSATADIDSSPDEATRAIELSKATGVQPTTILGDLESFEKHHKATLASDIVKNNSYISDYVTNNAMASRISNDDYGQLDTASQSIGKLGSSLKALGAITGSVLEAGVKGAIEGFGEKGVGEWILDAPGGAEYVKQHRLSAATLSVLASPVELTLRTLSGAIKGATDAAAAGGEEAYRQLGGSDSGARSFGRDMGGMMEMLTNQPLQFKTPLTPEVVAKARETMIKVKPWVDAGAEPPYGIDQTVDQVKQKQSDLDLKNLDEALKESAKSATRERSPELYRDFVAQHVQERTIGISGEAVAKLYGDKRPEIDDNLLGFVPRLREQLETAIATGGDIDIPLADWLAKVDPELAKELHDDIRVRSGGVTKNEVKLAAEAKAMAEEPKPVEGQVVEELTPPTPVQSVRKASAMDPLWEQGKLEDGLTQEDLGGGVTATLKPTDAFTAHEKAITEKIQSVLSRIVPEFETKVTKRLAMSGEDVAGAYIPLKDAMPIIAVSLEARDAGHTARHEAIHALRDYGFFTDGEWKAIEDAAREGNWIGKYNIRERYKKHGVLDDLDLLEEAIAEEFGRWGSDTEAPRKHLNDAVQKAFEKLAAFFKEVLQAMKEAFGHSPTIDELFEKIESGEVGRRAMGEGAGEAPKASAKEPELPQAGTTRMEDRAPFTGSFPGWMTMKQRETYMKLIERRNAEDVASLEKAIAAELERTRTKEWKANRSAVHAEVETAMEARPDVAADRYFASGELYGEKATKPKLDPDALSAEQKAALPEGYIAERGGMHPDDIAGLFGYPNGQAMLEALGKLTQARTQTGMTTKAYTRRVVDIETDRLMQERYGSTPAEVLEAAKDHVLSQTQMDLLHEQTYALASKAGLEFSLTKDQLKSAVQKAFGETPLAQLDSGRFMADAGRAGRQMEAAFLKDDAAEAFRQSQRQYLAGLMGKEAVRLEKELAQFEKFAKRYSRSEVSGIDPEYKDFIQQLLLQADRQGQRSAENIAETIERAGHKNLQDFVEGRRDYGWDLEVVDWLQAQGAKPVEKMSADEFREFKKSLDSLAFIGRAEKKINVGGQAVDYDTWKAEVRDLITELPLRSKEKQNKLIYQMDASLTRMEEIVRDLDLRRELGPLFNALIRPMMEAKHTEYQLQEALSKKLKDMEAPKGLKDDIPNGALIDPDTGTPFELKRSDMLNIMLNFGNRGNIEKFTKGWLPSGLDKVERAAQAQQLEAALWDMIHTHATKEDWKFVQEMWNIHSGWQDKIGTVYHNLSGLVPEWVKAEPIKTAHGDFAGGYFPIIYDAHYSDINRIRESKGDILDPKNYIRATTGNGFARERTGYIDRVEFQNTIDALPQRMQQVMHDISYRAAVVQANKIINDREIRALIRKHQGAEYEAQLKPWLTDIANHYNQNEAAVAFWNKIMKTSRMNLASHALGWNLKVIGSPDVGTLNLAAVARTLSNYDASVKLAWDKSLEIPHTYRNMDRDFRERLENLIIKNKWDNFKATAVRWSFIPLVKVSQGFRIVTFVNEYKKALARGLEDADASAFADQQVRIRHGATGVPDLPAIMRGNEGMKMATMFYGFFNAMYNWQRRIKGDVKAGEYMTAVTNAWGAVMIPAIFGALLFNKPDKDDKIDSPKSWGKSAAKAVGLQLVGTIPFARDLGSMVVEGIRPSTPMGSLFQAMANSGSDLRRAFEGKTLTKPIQHAANTIGLATGLPLGQVGRIAQFSHNIARGREHPNNIFKWYRGIIHGETKLR